MPPDPKITISVRLIPAVYTNIPIHITCGDPSASITVIRADIQHPNPFDRDGIITVECRSFIAQAVRSAIAKDGHDRRINWPTPPSPHNEKAAS